MIKIVIIGGGPGGHAAAVKAAKLGAEVTLIEKDKLGGVCLNRGCIPSKIMKHTAGLLKQIEKAADFGIDINEQAVLNLTALMKRKENIINTQIKALHSMLDQNKIHFIKGEAYIKEHGIIEVKDEQGNSQEIKWDKLIIASGSQPADLLAAPFDGERIISSNEALNLSEIPQSILIIGAGVIGCEFASILSLMGANVTLVEIFDRVLPLDSVDEDCSKILQREMKKKKITILLNKIVSKIDKEHEKLNVTLSSYPISETKSEETIKTDKVLVCTGRKSDTKTLGLNNIGIQTDNKGWILTNNKMETNIPNIYAIGDILGPAKVMLAHAAWFEGITAAQNAMGINSLMSYETIPSAIFTTPEIANVGLTETLAKKKGLNASSSVYLFRALGKAHVIGEIEGEAKIVFDKDTEQILGVHIIGPSATELIAEGTLAVQKKVTMQELAKTIHAHPTLAEIMMEVSHNKTPA